MFCFFGNPVRLSSIGQESINLDEAKSRIDIAVLDDNAFSPKESLETNKFRIIELGPDIRSLDQISAYSIIICDVDGVGRAFGSKIDGAHLVTEIRKSYPDKFLMAYTGLTYSLAITNALTAADRRIEKDASIEVWIKNLEFGINEIANPRNRWMRMRRAMLDRGFEMFDVLKLEQAFIKSITHKKPEILADRSQSSDINAELKELIIKFSATAFATLIGKTIGL